MPRIIVDYDPAWDEAGQIEGDSSDLVYFLSWAFSARYGGNHELAEASMLLRGELGIDIKPLLTFADREVEEPEDEEQLERVWQEAGPLAASCQNVAKAFREGDERLVPVRDDHPGLVPSLDALASLAAAADQRGSRIRVTFELEG